MTLFDERPPGPRDDPLEDRDTQPEKTERFRIETPSTFVKRPMRERRDGGIVTFIGVRYGLLSRKGSEAGTDPTPKEPQ
jgi:hypothetical protein